MATAASPEEKFSCSVCLDLFTEPATIPCGHSFCLDCIGSYWDQNDQTGVYSCPQCRENFTPRQYHDRTGGGIEENESSRPKELGERQAGIEKLIEERLEELERLNQAVQSLKLSAQEERAESEQVRSIERIRTEVGELIGAKEKAAVSRADEQREQLEQEIQELRKRKAEMELLSETEDHLHFLQYPTNSTATGSDPDPSADPPAVLRLVDIVLECSLVEEGGGRLSMFASAFSRQPATLVLRKVGVPEHETLDSYTEYQPPPFDPEALIFEVEVTSASIPGAESLLHADCNEQEVTCEISQYYPQDEVSETAWFICSLQVEGGGVSATMVMRTQPITGEVGMEPQKQKKLDLPLSDSGTIQLAAQFNVFTSMPSVSTALGGTVLLDCGFTGEQHIQEVQVEWRVQHKGNGRRVLHFRSDTNEGVSDRPGAQIDSARLAAHRNASLFLPGFRVVDEGTYICIVTAGPYQAQQVIQVQVQVLCCCGALAPPVVGFSPGGTPLSALEYRSFFRVLSGRAEQLCRLRRRNGCNNSRLRRLDAIENHGRIPSGTVCTELHGNLIFRDFCSFATYRCSSRRYYVRETLWSSEGMAELQDLLQMILENETQSSDLAAPHRETPSPPELSLGLLRDLSKNISVPQQKERDSVSQHRMRDSVSQQRDKDRGNSFNSSSQHIAGKSLLSATQEKPSEKKEKERKRSSSLPFSSRAVERLTSRFIEDTYTLSAVTSAESSPTTRGQPPLGRDGEEAALRREAPLGMKEGLQGSVLIGAREGQREGGAGNEPRGSGEPVTRGGGGGGGGGRGHPNIVSVGPRITARDPVKGDLKDLLTRMSDPRVIALTQRLSAARRDGDETEIKLLTEQLERALEEAGT
ncbi:Tapasin-related protein [Acipenser ruthenus]|uniref:Tapasin-related protein n=1 Tax=Acipenser ruthenus TaxID=7906 RepID=A0A662YUJ8_ACIRT|nr:Tapasin-related protein [Acipenser ruthenus]